jgi:exodeoxyribonuclease VII large subunit
MKLLTVTELSFYLRELLDADEILRDIWVEGEVSNFNRHSSGHCYFTLKDGDSQLSAVAWKATAARIGTLPRNGDAILAHGRISYYEGRGQIQIVVDDLRPAGVGILQAQYERLKMRLEAEGLFDYSRKRALPPMPHRIGIVTSPTGAALQDILQVIGRRYPLAEVLVAPCRVQGSGAADTIVEALYALYELPVDLIIVARGGGSIEDLWAFNEETVARAVFASPVPVVSGVGHETDTTIIDYVADLRAPTPSAAAELCTPDAAELAVELAYAVERMDVCVQNQISQSRSDLAVLVRRFEQHSPERRIERDRQKLDELVQRAERRIGHVLALEQTRLQGLQRQLVALNPQAILARGYAVVRGAHQQIVTHPDHVVTGELLTITLRGGELQAKVE